MKTNSEAVAIKTDELISEQVQHTSAPKEKVYSDVNTERLSALLRDIEQETPITSITPPVIRPVRNISNMLRSYILTDAIGIIGGFLCAWTLALITNILFRGSSLPNTVDDITPIAKYFLIGGGVILWFEHSSHYSVRLPYWIETKKIVSTICFAMLIDGFLQFATKQDESRLWLMSSWLFAGTNIIILRAIWRDVLRRRGVWSIPAIIVGNKQSVEDVRRALASEPSLGYNIVGDIDDLSMAFKTSGYSWKALCSRYNADYVILAMHGSDLIKSEQALAQLMREDIPYSIAPALYKAPVFGMVPQYFFNHDVMLLTQNRGLDRGLPCFLKRTFDIVVSATALVLLSPFLAIVALLVSKDGGPVFFGDKRLGLSGENFSCLKFRSMIINSDEVLHKYLEENPQAHEEWEKNHKLTGGDPRVTTIGRFLRRTSMGELPQLINVLKGEMSIVGPRPIIVGPRPIIGTETEKYGNDITYYCRVRPGITGLWQVSGRADVSYAERVRMDAWYVRNWSVWHDIAIIFKTIPVLLKSKGAY